MATKGQSSTVSSRNGVQILCDFKDTEAFRVELLCSVSERIPPRDILAVFLHKTCVNMYFSQFDHVRTLMKEGLLFQNENREVRYLYTVFYAHNVPPTTTYSEIANIFGDYGNVKEIITLPFCAEDHRFQHILGSERQIFVELTQKEPATPVPNKLELRIGQTNDITFKAYCLLCENEGHNTNDCKFKWTAPNYQANNRQRDSDYSTSNNNSPIYIPEDVFHCIDTDTSALHVDTKASNAFMNVVDSDDSQLISPPPPTLTANISQTASPVDSNGATSQHSFPTTTDSAYSSTTASEAPPSSPSVSQSSSTPLASQSSTTNRKRGRPFKPAHCVARSKTSMAQAKNRMARAKNRVARAKNSMARAKGRFYSIELKKAIIKEVNAGHMQSAVSKKFGVSPQLTSKWWRERFSIIQ